jgi:spore germination protein KC
MRPRRILISVLATVLAVMPLLLSGCWDRQELESLGLIQALGLDPSSDGRGVSVTTLLAIPSQTKSGGGGGGGEGPGTFIITMEAPSIYEAFNKINTTVNREITLLQNSVIIIGDALARKGLRPWIDNLIRFREMRRTVNILIAHGKAADLMQVQPKLEKNAGEYFQDLIGLSKSNGMFPITTLNDFMYRYEAYAQDNYAPYLAKYQRQPAESGAGQGSGGGQGGGSGPKQEETPKPPTEEAKDIRCIGTAVFHADKMVGALDNYESQMLLLLTNHFREAFLTIEDPIRPNFYIVFRLIASNPTQIRYQPSGGQQRFRVQCRLEADLVSIQSGIDYTAPDKEELLGKKIAAVLARRIRRVITKAQKEFHSDIFGFGNKVRMATATSSEWDRFDWPAKFPDADIRVGVKVAIRRVGVQFQPPQRR